MVCIAQGGKCSVYECLRQVEGESQTKTGQVRLTFLVPNAQPRGGRGPKADRGVSLRGMRVSKLRIGLPNSPCPPRSI
jgi:hypothetical protein